MNYTIKSLQTRSKNGVEVDQLLSLEVTYDATETFLDENGEEQTRNKTSTHNKVVPLGANLKEEAVTFAAELEIVLEEPKEVTIEEVVVASKDREVKKADIDAKVAADEALKADI